MEQFKPRPRVSEPTGTYESPLGTFDVIELKSITPTDIATGDRAFIHTESGNRYMLRRSESRGGELVMYNEREGNFAPESGHPFLARDETFAAIGKPFEYFTIMDEKNNTGFPGNSTNVVRIEVRKGLDAAGKTSPAGQQLGHGLADALKATVRGTRRGPKESS